MYKELSILGVISFLLFLLETMGAVEHSPKIRAFHYCHLALFFLGLIFILQVR